MKMNFYQASNHPYAETMLASALKRQVATDKQSPRFRAQFQRQPEAKIGPGKKEDPGSLMSFIRREVAKFDVVFTAADIADRLPKFGRKSVMQTLHDAAKLGIVVKIGKGPMGVNVYRRKVSA